MKRPSRPAILQTKALSIKRNGTTILGGIEWTIKKGEQWVILGANGSGKTSLLKALTGYMTPTDGSITVLDEEYGETDWRELRKHIGVVSASISQMVHDEDDGLEIVAGGKNAMIGFWGRITAADRARARRLLNAVGVGYTFNRTWEVLSQGERQRVLIARSLMASPAILVLDEPCSGLDPVARERFLQDIGKLARKPTAPAMIFVTHHIEEILPAFTHVLALRKGKIVYSGTKAGGLNEEVLGKVFGAKIQITRERARYWLSTQG